MTYNLIPAECTLIREVVEAFDKLDKPYTPQWTYSEITDQGGYVTFNGVMIDSFQTNGNSFTKEIDISSRGFSAKVLEERLGKFETQHGALMNLLSQVTTKSRAEYDTRKKQYIVHVEKEAKIDAKLMGYSVTENDAATKIIEKIKKENGNIGIEYEIKSHYPAGNLTLTVTIKDPSTIDPATLNKLLSDFDRMRYKITINDVKESVRESIRQKQANPNQVG